MRARKVPSLPTKLCCESPRRRGRELRLQKILSTRGAAAEGRESPDIDLSGVACRRGRQAKTANFGWKNCSADPAGGWHDVREDKAKSLRLRRNSSSLAR